MQEDDRNYIAIRVFAQKFKKEMEARELDQKAKAGKEQLIGETYKAYFPSSQVSDGDES